MNNTIVVRDGNVEVKLVLDSKIMIIGGESGTGKTLISHMFKQPKFLRTKTNRRKERPNTCIFKLF